ncbi:NAD(P) transhydrogenase subunit alpha [Aliiruegeria lutimaris]|uniref:NAD(P) transhydrogenase subunit alpha n=1 Tax=Aliiruegeria lutimaris TaxID=571298 RepID=A0A1G9EEJ1_9RHOB|nr:NAD(P) transhydrogenase subunit alpha [Aliiruegeria lutimaris]
MRASENAKCGPAEAGLHPNERDGDVKIGSPREVFPGESRVAMTPDSAKQLQKLGYDCVIESGAGIAAGFSDALYAEAGVEVVNSAEELFASSDIIAKVRPPEESEIGLLSADKTLISFFYPASNEPLMEAAKQKGASVIAMDMVPRISRAQKMDALSSMANIAGYRAVIEAGNNFGRFFTGQVTAAGKVPPAKVLVVGAGVAGLAAIGTSTSLGAITYAFDVRPEVAEQIESMGAEFVYLEFDEEQTDGAATGGYAAPSSPEFREAQLAKFRELAPEVDIVITTALIPNRDAPVLWTKDMVEMMKPGSVIVDLAAERGGNCELTVKDEKIVTENGVTIVGYTDFPSRMAAQSSTLYATNIRHMMTDLTPEKDGKVNHNMEDDVIRGATITHEGAITFPPPPPKIQAIAAAKPKEPVKELTREEKLAIEREEFRKQTRSQAILIGVSAALLLLVGAYAPASFMQHFIVFVLAVFVGFQVIWNVAHSLHTPLMAVTNAISSIIIVGALMQIGSGSFLVILLASLSVFMAGINIFGGFLVTRRMLAMFQKS